MTTAEHRNTRTPESPANPAYTDFLRAKVAPSDRHGFPCDLADVSPILPAILERAS